MKEEKIRLEFSGVELLENEPDWAIRKYPEGLLFKLMKKANELGLEGKTIDVVEVQENFATGAKYIDFIVN